jgi:hypothetical protein
VREEVLMWVVGLLGLIDKELDVYMYHHDETETVT